jgi:hypothetical protein
MASQQTANIKKRTDSHDVIQGVAEIRRELVGQGLNWSISQIYKRIADGTLKGAVAKVSHKNIIASRAALRARIAALIAGAG